VTMLKGLQARSLVSLLKDCKLPLGYVYRNYRTLVAWVA
jgi:hypothetical protein